MAITTFKQGSRTDWGVSLEQNEALTLEQIKTGCLMRIADGMDDLRRNILGLMADRDRHKARAENLERQNRGLKGEITKLKKKLAEGGG